MASIKLQPDVLCRSEAETAELAVKVHELPRTLDEKWLTADFASENAESSRSSA